MKYICPLITVEEIPRARKFYEELLNQKVKYDFGENITFHGDFALQLRTHYASLLPGYTIQGGSNSFELYFEHDAIDELAATLQAEGVLFIHEVTEQPWRQKAMRFYDPDKNIIEVGESLEFLVARLYREKMTIKEISAAVGVPESFVKTHANPIQNNKTTKVR